MKIVSPITLYLKWKRKIILPEKENEKTTYN